MSDPAPFVPVPDFEGTFFDRATGRPELHVTRPAADMLVAIQSALAAGQGLVPGHVPFDKLIDPDTGAVRARDEWALTTGTNHVTGIPEGAQVRVDGQHWAEVVDGRIEIAAEWPQDVEVLVIHPRHGEARLRVPCAPVTGKIAAHAVRIAQDVSLLRANAYPPIGDQLDALIKGLAKLPGAQAVPELKGLIDASAAVKAAFPKQG